ncbi:hypothetical protein TetV_445 [Tetraselmis virus 1]|uniref:Uncharacterized protein n=1 Tax=Tetraselmis virus 1 TaxID=2060617 RepID=A0A2P0VNQ1_9VIRU|nr:hypothetical protein QJ968_gp609 [Tetraselmis virus 1]AUF82527.1 hypothetical protein TetV_445 [Tetraselmis virus 1]
MNLIILQILLHSPTLTYTHLHSPTLTYTHLHSHTSSLKLSRMNSLTNIDNLYNMMEEMISTYDPSNNGNGGNDDNGDDNGDDYGDDTADEFLEEFMNYMTSLKIESYLNKEPHVRRSFIVTVPGSTHDSVKEYTVYAVDGTDAISKVCKRHAGSFDEAISMAATATSEVNLQRLKRKDSANENEIIVRRA